MLPNNTLQACGLEIVNLTPTFSNAALNTERIEIMRGYVTVKQYFYQAIHVLLLTIGVSLLLVAGASSATNTTPGHAANSQTTCDDSGCPQGGYCFPTRFNVNWGPCPLTIANCCLDLGNCTTDCAPCAIGNVCTTC